MDTATETWIDPTKTASKRVVQETVDTRGDLFGNKIADKTTSVGRTKSKEKEDETNKIHLHTTRKKTTNNDLRRF